MSKMINLENLKTVIANQQKEAADIFGSVNAVLQKAISETDEKRKLQFVADAHEKMRNAKKVRKEAELQNNAFQKLLEVVEEAS